MICPVSGKCGGCVSIEQPYEETLQAKQQVLANLFPRCSVEPILGMPDPYHYRHKVYATFGRDEKGRLAAGLYERNSHRLVFSRSCRIQHPAANAIMHDFVRIAAGMKLAPYDEDRKTGILRHLYLRVSHSTGQVLLVIVIGSKSLPGARRLVSQLTRMHPEIASVVLNWNPARTSMILGERQEVLFGQGYIRDTIGGISFRISPQSFYQVNPEMTEVLYQKAISLAGLGPQSTVLDLCCGIGTISLLAARQAREVVGVEIAAEAVQDAVHNARRNQIRNARFYCDDAEQFLDRLLDRPDVVFLDPPRAGMSQQFMVHLASLRPQRIVYVSCNPATQVRDLKNLTCRGYRIQCLQPVDQFPFTDSIENIALLSR